MAQTTVDGHLDGNSTKKKENHTKRGIEDESVVPMRTKNRRLLKIHRICSSCISSSSIGGTQETQETQEKNMISALAKSPVHDRRGPNKSSMDPVIKDIETTPRKTLKPTESETSDPRLLHPIL